MSQSLASSPSSDRIKIVEHLISLPHAVKIMKDLKLKRHARLGFSYELTDTGIVWRKQRELAAAFPWLVKEAHERSRYEGGGYRYIFKVFSDDYKAEEPMFHLVVFRDAVNTQ